MLGRFPFVSVLFFLLQAALVLPVEVNFVYMLNLKGSVPSYASLCTVVTHLVSALLT